MYGFLVTLVKNTSGDITAAAAKIQKADEIKGFSGIL